TFALLRLKGSAVKAWLEKASTVFNTIDPANAADQMLVDSHVASYNFDVMDGLTYDIDITKPVGERIGDLRYKSKPLAPGDEFLLASNNYRAGGASGFPGGGETSETALSEPEESRAILTDYVRARGVLTRAKDGAHHTWSFAPIKIKGRVLIEVAGDAKDSA